MALRKRNRHIDREIRPLIEAINERTEYETLGSCFGHGKYPTTIVARTKDGRIIDFISGKEIPRKRNFYRRDNEGYYYIPEVCSSENR